MRYIAAYMLCSLSGKAPKPADIENVLSSVGVECDKNCVEQLFNDIKERSIEVLVSEGVTKLASVPSGVSASPSAQVVNAAAPVSKVEEAKVEKESSSESEADMGFGLFD